jgi:hypothetical protein
LSFAIVKIPVLVEFCDFVEELNGRSLLFKIYVSVLTKMLRGEIYEMLVREFKYFE